MEELLSSINWALFAPFIFIQAILIIVALIDWVKQKDDVRGNRWIWLVIICLVTAIGPILYFLFGRSRDA